MAGEASERNSVEQLLETFCLKYGQRDIEEVMSCFSHEPDTIVLGAGEDERRVGLDEIRDQILSEWRSVDSASFRPFNILSTSVSAVSWLAADLDVSVCVHGQEHGFLSRLTGVAEFAHAEWRWRQVHLSVPAGSH